MATASLIEKHERLKAAFQTMGRVVVAFSGGVDSALVLRIAHDVLGHQARALTAHSASMMAVELEEAQAYAASLGVEHQIVQTNELAHEGYVANQGARCFHCRSALFESAALHAHAAGATIVDGIHADDQQSHQQGLRAGEMLGVRHPLLEAGLGKLEVRALAEKLQVPSWNKPQMACLASRLPRGMTVTVERLRRVERLEMLLRDLQFQDIRARLVKDNENMVRIEVSSTDFPRLLDAEVREQILACGHAEGFEFVTFDLAGFRSGSTSGKLVSLTNGARQSK